MGGDEGCSYTSRGVLAEALLTGRWGYLAAELRTLAVARRQSLLRVAWSEMSPYLLSTKAQDRVRRLTGRAAAGPSLPQLTADLLRPEKTAGWRTTFAPMPPDARRIRFIQSSGPGLSRRAEQWALMAARYGMSAAFPLLDRRVVEFALSLPSMLYRRDGWSRRVFRDAMAGVLPDEILLRRGKHDITPETPLYIATQQAALRERLPVWRRNPAITAFFDLDVVEARLNGLPPADQLARGLEPDAGGDDPGVGHATSLMRVVRVMEYLEKSRKIT